MTEAYAGIDVAIAKKKWLPISVCVWRGSLLEPLPLNHPNVPRPPRGSGNVAMCDSVCRKQYAKDTVAYLRIIEQAFGVTIRRVGIDAPSAPRPSAAGIRRAEQALDERRISYIQTPSEEVFSSMAARVRAHLSAGGAESRLPGANQLWMLFGFELYRALSAEGWTCLEVYPQATVRVLGAGEIYKAASGGTDAQLRAVAQYTGWPEVPNRSALKSVARGKDHDRLDAYLAAWVAALPEEQREALGSPPNDAIWVPQLERKAAASP